MARFASLVLMSGQTIDSALVRLVNISAWLTMGTAADETAAGGADHGPGWGRNLSPPGGRRAPGRGDHPDRGGPVRPFIHAALSGYGVDDRFVTAVPALPTPVTFCEIFPPDDFPIYFYRYPKAPDREIRAEDLDYAAIRAAGVFWVTVTGLSDEPSRSATIAALEARGKARVTVLDLDYRPAFWSSRAQAQRWAQAALRQATVAVGNLEECETATGERDPVRAGQALLSSRGWSRSWRPARCPRAAGRRGSRRPGAGVRGLAQGAATAERPRNRRRAIPPVPRGRRRRPGRRHSGAPSVAACAPG